MKNILWRHGRSQDKQDKDRGRYAQQSFSGRECDRLTGVADEKYFKKMVDTALEEEGAQGCLLILDVDRMQEINEQFGHDTGDRVLQEVAVMLRENFRSLDGIGRLEEDEFALWIAGLSAENVSGIRRRVAYLNDRLMHMAEDMPVVTLSAGVAVGEAGEDFKCLYRRAKEVLSRVKERGRCGCEIYEKHRQR